MFRRFKNLVLIILLISLIFTLMACNNSKEEDKTTINPSDIEDKINDKDKVVGLLPEEEQDSIMNKYYNLLVDNKVIDDITDYIDKNIHRLSKENIEIMITALEDYLSSKDSPVNEDYALLHKYRDYVSEEMKSYLELIELETRNLFTDGEKLNVDISEIMNRAIEAEKHLDKFPEGKIYNKIYDLYYEYIKGSILGTGNPYIFAEDGSTTIKEENIEKYKGTIENNKGSKTSEILSQYVDLLESENGDLNSNLVNEFYDRLDILIEDMFIKS